MLGETEKSTLLEVAEASIRHGLEHHLPLDPEPSEAPPALREPGACFVTLHRFGELRGCIGTLEPHRPLLEDAAENAFAAAFRDPRFPPLVDSEWEGLDLEVSVLTPAEPLEVASEEELLAALRPGTDGLILQEYPHRATFLPAVWLSLPDRRQFLDHLWLKAGLNPGYWSDTIRFARYRTVAFGRPVQRK